jgi:hypothetical protein
VSLPESAGIAQQSAFFHIRYLTRKTNPALLLGKGMLFFQQPHVGYKCYAFILELGGDANN